jgi:hypothetical protein
MSLRSVCSAVESVELDELPEPEVELLESVDELLEPEVELLESVDELVEPEVELLESVDELLEPEVELLATAVVAVVVSVEPAELVVECDCAACAWWAATCRCAMA